MAAEGLVSVIIPVFNVRPYLAEALDSVLAQTYENLEILVIDDGSTDGSGEMCDAYALKGSRMRVVHQDNAGLSGARNTALDLIQGEAVVFFDADDVLCPDYVKAMMSVMIAEGADIVLCKYSVYGSKGMTWPRIAQGSYNREDALRALAEDDTMNHVWNKLYRRQLWDTIRFPAGHDYEDLDTTYKLFNRCKTMRVIDQPMYIYRMRAGSITNTPTRKSMTDRLTAMSHFLAFVEENTPAVFGEAQLKRNRVNHLDAMIHLFLTDPQDEGLRERIRQEGRALGIGSLRVSVNLAWLMVCYCPGLFRVIYPVFHKIRTWSRRWI